MPITGIDLTKSEEQAFRRIVHGELVGFACRPIPTWIGLVVAAGAFLLYSALFYWLETTDVEMVGFASLVIILTSVATLSYHRELKARDAIIRKLYRFLEEGRTHQMPE